MAVFFSTIAIGQVVVFEDNFDSYSAGQLIACQNPTVWTTWNQNPCSATEDACISNAYSYSGGNSLLIKQDNDVVRDLGLLTGGICEINFQVYIPTGKAGYFNTLADFAPPTYVWAMQVFFNPPGTGTVDAAGVNAAAFSYPQNKWFPVKVVANLIGDCAEFWVDGSLVHSWQWSKGTFGTTSIPLQLDGTDFFGNTINDEMYIDNYNITHFNYISIISSNSTGGNWSSPGSWTGGIVPASNIPVEITSTATMNLDNNIIRDAITLVKGRLNCGPYTMSGTGDFILSSNATLEIGLSAGLSVSGATGNLQVSGLRLLNPMASYIYDGNAAQITGNGLPTTINNLTMNNSSGLTLSSSTSVSGTLNLESGCLTTSTNSLTLGTSVSNLGSLILNSGRVIGDFRRWLSSSTVPNVLFPVGTSPSKYTPVSLNNVTGNGIFGVNAVSGKHPNTTGTNVLQMYWKLNNNGITSADLLFNYLDADVVGNETQYSLGKYDGNWFFLPSYVLNTVSNSVSISGVNSFSDWTLGEPNALPVELSSLTAYIRGNNIKLNWETATEVNNYGFEIERNTPLNPLSIREAEGMGEWEKIGFVNGNGNSGSPKSYSFEDRISKSGRYFYRLKQIDNNGKFEYSKIIEVTLDSPNKFELSQNFPNPFNPKTTINFKLAETGQVKLTIYNILGQEIKVLLNENQESGFHAVTFEAGNLDSGMYLYKLESGSFMQTRKMTLIK